MSYYFQILNKDEIPKVGIPHVYYFVVLDIENNNINNGVVEKIYLAKLSAEKVPFDQGLPSWIDYSSVNNFISMTIPNTYQTKNLSLIVQFTGEIYKQIEIFPLAESSLSWNFFYGIGINILSPSSQHCKIEMN